MKKEDVAPKSPDITNEKTVAGKAIDGKFGISPVTPAAVIEVTKGLLQYPNGIPHV